MHPYIGRKIANKHARDKKHFDHTAKEREYSVGEEVLIENFRGFPKWIKGTLSERTGPVSYKTLVENEDWKRHADKIRRKTHVEADKGS